MAADHFILRPLDQRGGGSGHMRRLYRLGHELAAESGADCLLVVDNPACWAGEIPGFPTSIRVKPVREISDESRRGRTLILFDCREAALEDFQWFSRFGMPVLLDDDGPARRYAPFVVDSIPGPRRNEANMASTAFMNLPPRRREPDPGGAILVSFGGQDPAALTIPTLKFLIEDMGFPPNRITAAHPAGEGRRELHPIYSGLTLIEAPEKLQDQLHRFGLVICSFGLTAFEALAIGCAVITVEPSRYHGELSRFFGFPTAGHAAHGRGEFSQKQGRRLMRLLQNPPRLIEAWRRLSEKLERDEPRQRISDLIRELSVVIPRCAACDSPLPPVIARFPRRSYYLCGECGILGLYRFDSEDEEYGPDYFEQEYRHQYGRTYMEDFQTIKSMGHSRLDCIRRYRPGGRLLDIGCAYGPFLQAAIESGYEVYGTDVSEAAVEYVRDVLGYPAAQGPFPVLNPAAEFKTPHFDVVTLWYVIEHFRRLDPVLKCLSAIIPPKGLLALSTPNAAGISARRSLTNFLRNSPRDHYTIWSPRSAGRLLGRYGFRVVQTRITGHHPERFARGVKKDSVLYKLIMLFSRICGLGDTFELYAVREEGG